MNELLISKKVSVLSLVFLFVIFVLFSNESSAEGEVSVHLFGATGSGKVEETDFIQRAIDFQSAKGGGTVHFPKGVYLVDALKSIVLKDNINLEFASGAILKALPNNSVQYEILEIHDVKNVKILGYPEILGERKQHLGTSGEWGFGISVRGSTDVTIENAKVSDCWGDGIYIGSTVNQNYSENIEIVNPILNNNRRQGISIISAINLYVYNAKVTNTNGTDPQSGIDIEPNLQNEKIQNVNLINLSTSNNKGRGLLITLHNLKDSIEPVSINVDTTNNLEDGYRVKNLERVKGKVKIGGKYYLSEEPTDTKRISGSNRYNTAVAISQEGWVKAETVVLARANDFPDALSGGPLAYQKNAPILLTDSKNLNQETKQEIQRLGAKKIIILGSEGAVSKEVEAEVKSMGLSIERIGGKNRFETAALIAQKLGSDKAVIANGQSFPDVLSISAYASKSGVPILLTRSDRLPEETANALSKVSETYVVGSTGVVNNEVFRKLPKPMRFGGQDRYETGYEVVTNLKMGTDRAFLATGLDYPDALSGSVLAAKYNAPILLVRSNQIPEATKKQLAMYHEFSIFGGTGAISDNVKHSLD